tara:strand:+ start:479 stop:1204 length:726 start_codon:yes stop_codon:yes gene_type:complete
LNTINIEEIKKFEKLAHEWWNPVGKFKPLHNFNPIRLKYIKKKLIFHFSKNSKLSNPLKKMNILDIGCGGGLMSEPMARLGANVTGVDASKKNIEVAKLHAKKMGLKIKYIHGNLESLKFNKKFDVILNLEVVEHVANLDAFINHCSKALKNDGLMFVATLNRTLKSYTHAILGAEYILRWLPIGTHEWDKFITPNELESLVTKNKLSLLDTMGVKYDLLSGSWKFDSDISVNYITTIKKN